MTFLRRLPTARWAALACVLMAALLTLRWIFKLDVGDAIPGVAEAGIVAAVLLMCGSIVAWIMAGWPHGQAPGPTARRGVQGLALALSAPPLLMLAEAFTGLSFGVDIARQGTLPTIFNPHPGRISPNGCIALLLLFGSMGLIAGAPSRAAQRASAAFIGGALIVATLGLLGYLLRLGTLYRWGAFNRLTLPTAVGVTLLSIALWHLRLRWNGALQRIDQHEQRITRRSLAVLTLVAVAAGAGGFAALESEFERTRQEDVRSSAVVTAEALVSAMDNGVWLADTIATRPVVVELMGRAADRKADAADRERLRAVNRSLLAAGVTAARLLDNAGATLAEAGSFATTPATPALALAGGYAATGRLAWADGFLLVTDQPVTAQGIVVGRLQLEQRLTLADHLVTRVRDGDASADVLVCSRSADTASCLPSKLYPRPFTMSMFDAQGHANLPIDRALRGESGVTLTPDLRGVPVVAAFVPLGRSGLAMVVKADIEAVYATIRQRLGWLALLLAVLVLAGTWALRQHVRPLVKQIANAQARARAILDNSSDAFISLNGHGDVTDWNLQAEKLFGYAADEALGRRLSQLIIPPEQREAHEAGMAHFRHTGRGKVVNQQVEVVAQHRDGHRLDVELSVAAMADGDAYVAHAFVRDISERKAASRQLAASERRLRSITDNLPALISHLDKDHHLTFANQTFLTWMGVDPEQAMGGHLTAVAGPDRYAERLPHLKRAQAGERVEFESVSQALGITRHLHTVYIPDRHDDGSVQGVYVLSTDVTAMKEAEHRLQDLARNDPLTGLPNRREFEHRLVQALSRARRQQKAVALIFLDVDHFKGINDGHGHAAGDVVLKEFAKRVRAAVRTTDTAARLAGDEFVVILEGLAGDAEASHVAAKLVDVIRAPMYLPDGAEVRVTTSVGMACWGGTGEGAEDILDRADRALYRAKAAGRDTFAQTIF